LDKESRGLALSVISTRRQILIRISLAALWLIASVGAVTLLPSRNALATTAVPRCSASQLKMSIFGGRGAYSAAGNHAEAFIFHNISERDCSLQGYPTFRFTPSSFQGRSTKITHNGGQIFVAVPPRLVVIRPSDSASFGLSYGDAYNQSPIYDGTSCMTKIASVWLPVQHPSTIPFTAALKINFCFAGFQFGITSIQSGQFPKRN
jgi:Protein of unknown function (DUF4232)